MDDGEILNKIESCYRGYDKESVVSELYKGLSSPNCIYNGHVVLGLAATGLDIESIRMLLATGADPSLVGTSNEDNALHDMAYNVEKEHIWKKSDAVKETVSVLLDAGVSPLRKNGDGRTCVFIAAEKGNFPMISAFTEAKKKIDIPNNNGDTPLHVACEYANSAAESYFKYGKPKYDKILEKEGLSDSERESAQKDHDRYKEDLDKYFLTVKYLIEGGADPDRNNNYDRSAKKVAFDCMDPRMPALLNGTYSEDGSTDQCMDAKGMNLVQATIRKDHDAMIAILNSGADPNELSDEDGYFSGYVLAGKLPLSIACLNGDLNGIRILIEHGADPNIREANDWMPVAYCFLAGAFSRDPIKTVSDVLDLMKGKGMDIDAAIDKEGNTIFNRACSDIDSNSESTGGKFVQILLRSGADHNKADNNGVTPLMHTCAGGSRGAENVQLSLLENGVDVTKKDNKGRTALMYAASNGSYSAGKLMAEMLFEFGDPQIDAVDIDGKNALELAVEAKNDGLVNYLLARM